MDDPLRIRARRRRLRLSQAALANRLDTTRNTIARWERGELTVDRPGMVDLALKGLEAELEAEAGVHDTEDDQETEDQT